MSGPACRSNGVSTSAVRRSASAASCFVVALGEVHDGELHGQLVRDPLACEVGREGHAQRLVAGDHPGQRPPQRVDVDRAGDVKRVGEVVRAVRRGAQTRGEQDLLLSLVTGSSRDLWDGSGAAPAPDEETRRLHGRRRGPVRRVHRSRSASEWAVERKAPLPSVMWMP